jgi:hypothetical protein
VLRRQLAKRIGFRVALLHVAFEDKDPRSPAVNTTRFTTEPLFLLERKLRGRVIVSYCTHGSVNYVYSLLSLGHKNFQRQR